jgi:hypothetical protein
MNSAHANQAQSTNSAQHIIMNSVHTSTNSAHISANSAYTRRIWANRAQPQPPEGSAKIQKHRAEARNVAAAAV